MPRPTNKETMHEGWLREMERKDRLSATGCLPSHCFHEQDDPKCRASNADLNQVRACCRCSHVE